MIGLRDVSKTDEELYESWRKDAGLREFMSRLEPWGCNPGDYDRSRVCWFIIKIEAETAGAVWLEKNSPDSMEAILGIFITGEGLRGKGTGTAAIKEAIRISRQRMSFEKVVLNVRKINVGAIHCYKKCGFHITGEGVKTTSGGSQIDFYIMEIRGT